MKAIVYQVGRFENPEKSRVRFCIKEFKSSEAQFEAESELSSVVFRDFLKAQGYSAKVVGLYPVSLILRDKFSEYIQPQELKDEFLGILKNPQEYLKNPKEFLDKVKNESFVDERLIIHSLGEYLGVHLNASFDDIVLTIFFDMVERYLNEEIEELYVDISSGHNIYITAMLEALRYFGVFSSLMHWLEPAKAPKLYLVYSDPIIGSSAKIFEIHICEQKYKAFFSSPISREEASRWNFSFLRNIYPDPDNIQNGGVAVQNKQNERNKRRKLREKIEMFCQLFSALKNNIPLYLYYQMYHSKDEIIEEILQLIEHAKDKLTKTYLTSPKFDKKAYTDAILSLGFYIGIVDVLAHHNITGFCHNTGIELEKIKKEFAGIYNLFGINTNYIMLGNEISNITKDTNDFVFTKGDIQNWQAYYKIKGFKNSQSNIDERNFFAHSGLEMTITEIRTENNVIYVRYKEDFNLNDINSWLKSRIG